MNYTIKAIPTVYKGRNYRSRLEARWAAFFDLCGWEYEYEPCDLNGWFPDFRITYPNGAYSEKTVLAEVKPIREFPQDVADKMTTSSGQFRDLLILGDGPIRYEDDDEFLEYIGFSVVGREENNFGGYDYVWGDCPLVCLKGIHARLVVCDSLEVYRKWMNDEDCDEYRLMKNRGDLGYWVEAANIIQHKPRRLRN